MSAVEYALDGRTARIHLARPERLNAVVPALVDGLLEAFDQATADDARAIVLAGRGRAFCSGYDLKEPDLDESPLRTRARVERIQDVTRAMRRFPGVVVGAVHGYALGAGAEFALGCDLVIAADDARLGFPEVGVGLSVTGGISQLLPAVVGPFRAKELLVLGERITAAHAHALGLVNRVVPVGSHEQEALAVAAQVAERPALATAVAKQAVDRGLDATLDGALAQEVEHALLTRAANERDVFGARD